MRSTASPISVFPSTTWEQGRQAVIFRVLHELDPTSRWKGSRGERGAEDFHAYEEQKRGARNVYKPVCEEIRLSAGPLQLRILNQLTGLLEEQKV